MKFNIFLPVVLVMGVLTSCNQTDGKKNQQQNTETDNTLSGKWVRIGHSGPVSFDFKENGIIEGDFGNDLTIDIRSEYEMKGDTVVFRDEAGEMCPDAGVYVIDQNRYYLAFNLVEDNCNGRIKTTMGYWTRPKHEALLKKLQEKIQETNDAEHYLNRARIYLALGDSEQARHDLDAYIDQDTTNPRAYINRAATAFPFDMKGVVKDCNKAIALDPQQKNAYFLRGLALYELGEKEIACEDFEQAIKLGFSILRIAEQQKCAEFWEK